MEENKARRVVDALRERGTDAELAQGIHDTAGLVLLHRLENTRASQGPRSC